MAGHDAGKYNLGVLGWRLVVGDRRLVVGDRQVRREKLIFI
jgi:hypothetical protein